MESALSTTSSAGITYGLVEPQWETPEQAIQFAAWIVSFQCRPLDWMMVCYPWGELDTPLENRRLEDWQIEYLGDLQKRLLDAQPEQAEAEARGELFNLVLRYSVASGHGIGKTAFVAMLIHWFASTHPKAQMIVTASTERQLQTKTWRELRKWQQLAVNGWMFDWTATAYKHRDEPELWFASAIPWSAGNPQAFAGAHEKYVLVVFDEASGIDPIIWETVEGALTTGKCLFLAFGNPTENAGGFHDTHHSKRHRWKRWQIDSRTVTFANRGELQQWLEDYGEDSDFFRTRVRGVFPRAAAAQFISYELVADAQKREIEYRDIPVSIPRVMGVDVARQGDDKTVILFRQGRKLDRKIMRFSDRDLMKVANVVARAIRETKPDVVFVDGVGIGAGVVDRLIQLGYDNVVEVQSGSKTGMDEREKKIHANLRSLMWERMREWLRSADIPADPELATDLCGPLFTYERRTNLQLIEPKDLIKKRGLPSPDNADALALTFAELVPTRIGGARSAEPEAV